MKRINLTTINQDLFTQLLAIDAPLTNNSIEAETRILIQLYASMLNGCAHCIAYHLKEADESHINNLKKQSLTAFEAAICYSDKEKAALALTKEMTLIAQKGISEQLYEKLQTYYTQQEIGDLAAIIITINAFNRLRMFSQPPLT